MMTLNHVWLDCDPGIDDAFAILLAGYTSSIKLMGISTVSGNQSLENVTRNTLKALNLFGLAESREENGGLICPVLKGCSRPILRRVEAYEQIHGESGLDTLNPLKYPDIPERVLKYVEQLNDGSTHFTSRMYNCFKQSPKPITLVAIGPLTNVALLIMNYPDVGKYIEKIVLMGGAIGVGNAGPVTEFNIQADPEAASYVFEAEILTYMVPLEVTHMARFTKQTLAPIESIGSGMIHILTEHLLLLLSRDFKGNCEFSHLHDPCAIAFVSNPEIFEYKLIRVDVETNSLLSFGQTVCDIHQVTNRKKNVHVCTRMNVDKFWDMMIAAIYKADELSPANNKLQ